MREVMEHFGAGFLELLGVVGMMVIVFDCMKSGGSLSNIVAAYMNSIC